MQYWKQAAKQHQHNNDCPNSFYYNITVQLVCSHVNTSSRPPTIAFPWQLVDGVMFPWKASSSLSHCLATSPKQALGFVCPLSSGVQGILMCLCFHGNVHSSTPKAACQHYRPSSIKLSLIRNIERFLRASRSNHTSPAGPEKVQMHHHRNNRIGKNHFTLTTY